MSRIGRRELLKVSAGLAAGSWASACSDPPTRPAASAPPGLEATVGWIEQTPRTDVFEVAAEKLAAGLTTSELLAALLVACARSLPLMLGATLHPFFTLRSAERMSVDLPWSDHLVPYFFALDMFKLEQEVNAPGVRLGALDEGAVPSATTARETFRAAMASWDAKLADAAIVGMVRSLSTSEVVEELLVHGCRDLSPIGHHVIAATQVLRTVDLVGWSYAETPLRALVGGLLELGKDGPTTAAFAPARARAASIRKDWPDSAPSDGAALDVLAAVRGATSEQAATLVADVIENGASIHSVLDGLLLANAELLLRFPSGSAVFPAFHALTNANGFRHVFRAASDPETRVLAALQAAAFYPLDRDEAITRAGADDSPLRIDSWKAGTPPATLDAVFDGLAKDRIGGAADARAWLENGGSAAAFADLARRTAIVKGAEEHDYKLPVAVFEELDHVSPAFRPHVLAATAIYLRLPSDPDWERYAEARDAITVALGGPNP